MASQDEDFSFLYLRNRSCLPGKLPFPPTVDKNKGAQQSRKRMGLFVWLWKQLSDKQQSDGGEDYKFSLWNVVVAGWFLLASMILVLVLTLSISSLCHKKVMGTHLWRWELSVLMVMGSRIACKSLIRLILCVLHMCLGSYHRLLYILYHVRYIARWCLISWLVVAAWEITLGELETVLDSQVMMSINKALTAIAILLSICLVKSLLVMPIAAWFHLSKYGEKIVDALYYEYLLEVLSSPPTIEITPYLPQSTVLKHDDLNPLRLSAWQRKKLMTGKQRGVASTIKCDSDARSEAEKIFQLVASDSQFIELKDLKRFLPSDDASKTLEIFRRTYEDSESIKISSRFLQEWMVHSFKKDRCLRLSLENKDAVSKKIGRIFSLVIGILLVGISIPLLGWGGTIHMGWILTSAFALTFFSGLIWKEHFFSMQLLFIRQHFDVGYEVEIQDVKLKVEKLNLMHTVFIGMDKVKQQCSNFGLCDNFLKNNSCSELPA